MLIKSPKYTVALSDERYLETVEDAKKNTNVLEGRETPEQIARGRVLSDAALCIKHQKILTQINNLMAHIDEILAYEKKASEPAYFGLLGAAENESRHIDFNCLKECCSSTDEIAREVNEYNDPIIYEEYAEWMESDEYRELCFLEKSHKDYAE